MTVGVLSDSCQSVGIIVRGIVGWCVLNELPSMSRFIGQIARQFVSITSTEFLGIASSLHYLITHSSRHSGSQTKQPSTCLSNMHNFT